MGEIPQAEPAPRSGESIEVRLARLEEGLKAETRLRETVTRADKQALDKAEAFITEKSEEHNNLLKQMKEERVTFVTKKDLDDARDRLFSRVMMIVTLITTVGGSAIVLINYLIRTAGK